MIQLHTNTHKKIVHDKKERQMNENNMNYLVGFLALNNW